MLELAAGDYRLVLEPERGGSIARFDWHGEPLLRPTCGASILDTACFPLVPFSNRIAHGCFENGGRRVTLAPNMPGGGHPHPLHGFGWLAAWRVEAANSTQAVLEHRYPEGSEWPWPYLARQSFQLTTEGLTMALDLTNLADNPMPAGLGFHPYFPRTDQTRYHGCHRGEWTNSPDCLPLSLSEHAETIDWWRGKPVGTRVVDTVYTGREGELIIDWPERGLSLTITPSANLPHTVVYTPTGADFFCVEPVSHITDAVNRPEGGMIPLAPGQCLSASISLSAASR